MNSDFVELLITCCRFNELELRSYIKKLLIENNFSIQEDSYSSERPWGYSDIHNLLAIRETPKVCLVSHTDVCRDHDLIWLYSNGPIPEHQVNPIVKKVKHFNVLVDAIQDKDCLLQVGGDDRTGVAIGLWLATNTDLPMGLLFTTDEEVGLLSAQRVKFPELMNFELLVQIDRGNQQNHQIVTQINGIKICNLEMTKTLVDLSLYLQKPRQQVVGLLTDVFAIKKNERCKNAINLTCGYHNSIGSDPDEYIVIHEVIDTMEYVQEIIKLFSCC
jgi:hypothetical protein